MGYINRSRPTGHASSCRKQRPWAAGKHVQSNSRVAGALRKGFETAIQTLASLANVTSVITAVSNPNLEWWIDPSDLGPAIGSVLPVQPSLHQALSNTNIEFERSEASSARKPRHVEGSVLLDTPT